MAAILYYTPFIPVFDFNGKISPGSTLTFYLTGTNIPQPVYTTAAMDIVLPQPVVSDASAIFPSIYMDPSIVYRVVLKDQNGVVLDEVDPYIAPGGDIITGLAASDGASKVGWIQAGTGAVPRTVLSKLRDIISVLDFGVVGNGTTNDTAALQAAIDATPDGGTLDFGRLTYLTNVLTVSKKIKITGTATLIPATYVSGRRAVIYLAPGSDYSEIDGITFDNRAGNLDLTSFFNAAISCGTETGTTYLRGISIRNCRVYSGRLAFLMAPQDVEIRNNTCIQSSIYLMGPFGAKVTGNTIEKINYLNNDASIVCQKTATSPYRCIDIVITDNKIRGSGGIAIVRGDNATVANNVMKYTLNPTPGFGIAFTFPDVNNLSVSGNAVIVEGGYDSTSYAGIECPQGTNVSIVGNTVSGFSSGIYLGPGILVSGTYYGVDGAAITGNTVINCLNSIKTQRVIKNITISGNSLTANPTVAGQFKWISGDVLGTYNGLQWPQNITISGNSMKYIEGISQTANLIDTGCIGLVVSDNTFEVTGTNANIACIRTGSVRYGKFVDNYFKSNSPGIGLGIVTQGGATDRGNAIVDNTFFNMNRGTVNSGSALEYNITYAGNTSIACTLTNAEQATSNAGMFGGAGSKMAWKAATPTAGTWKVGDRVFDTTGTTDGWRCSVEGTAGTLSGVTASTTAGSPTITPNTLTGLEEGQKITIAGVSGTRIVQSINFVTGVVTLATNADASVTSAAVAYSPPTFVAA